MRVPGPWRLCRSNPPRKRVLALQHWKVLAFPLPTQVYICLDSVESCGPCTPHSDTDDGGAGWEPKPESLGEALRRFNTSVEALPALTDFHTGRTTQVCAARHTRCLWPRGLRPAEAVPSPSGPRPGCRAPPRPPGLGNRVG